MLTGRYFCLTVQRGLLNRLDDGVWRAWIELSRVFTDREILDLRRPCIAYYSIKFYATAAKSCQHGEFGKSAIPAQVRCMAFFLVATIGTLSLYLLSTLVPGLFA